MFAPGRLRPEACVGIVWSSLAPLQMARHCGNWIMLPQRTPIENPLQMDDVAHADARGKCAAHTRHRKVRHFAVAPPRTDRRAPTRSPPGTATGMATLGAIGHTKPRHRTGTAGTVHPLRASFGARPAYGQRPTRSLNLTLRRDDRAGTCTVRIPWPCGAIHGSWRPSGPVLRQGRAFSRFARRADQPLHRPPGWGGATGREP